jgi:FK506-binding nuclear protein
MEHAIRSETVMSRFLGVVIHRSNPKRFTLRGSRLVLTSCALDLSNEKALSEPTRVLVKTPMQEEPVLLATLSGQHPHVCLAAEFFEEDELLTVLVEGPGAVSITGRVHLDRKLQDEIEDDEAEAARMKAALGASHLDSDDDGLDDEGDEDEGDDDEDAAEDGAAEIVRGRFAGGVWYRERVPEDSEAEAMVESAVPPRDSDRESVESDSGKSEAQAWMEALASLMEAGKDEEEATSSKADKPSTAASSKADKPSTAASSKADKPSKASSSKADKPSTAASSKADKLSKASSSKVAKRSRDESEREVRDKTSKVVSEQREELSKGAKRSKTSPQEKVLSGGVRALELFEGLGQLPKPGKKVTIKYIGKLKDGTVFDSSDKFEFRLGVGQVIPGFDTAVKSMRVGGRRRVVIPPSQGYGSKRAGSIPPNSHLVFDLELVKA